MGREVSRTAAQDSSPSKAAWRIAGIFAAASLAWIWITDYLLVPHESGFDHRFFASAGKGTLYTSIAAALIYWMVRRHVQYLQQTSRLLQAVANETTDAVFVKDVNGKYLFFNEAAAKFVGRSVADVLGRDDLELFEADSAASIMAKDRSVISTGRPTTHQEVATAAGITRTYSVTKAPFRDAKGKIVGLIGISRDLSEQIGIQNELAESEREFRELADAIPQIVFIASPDGALTHVNRRAADYVNVPAGDLTGWKWGAFVHPEDLQRTTDAWIDAIRSGQSKDVEFRLLRGDGEYRWHVGRQVPFRDATGAVRRWYGTVTDIQDQRDRQTALAESEARLRLALQGAHGGVWDWNLRTKISWWSDEMCDLWGAPRDSRQNLEQSIAYIHEEDRAQVEAAVRHALETRGDYLAEFRIRLPSDEIRWMVSKGRMHLDVEGQPARMVGITFDVTERALAEQALRKAQHFNERLTDIVPSVLYVLDIESHRNLYINKAAANSLGYEHGALAAAFRQGLPAIMHPDDLPGFFEHSANWPNMADGEVRGFEYRMKHADGSWRWFASRDAVFARNAEGRVKEVIGVATDITETKRAEAAIRESEARFRRVFEYAPTGIAISDLEGRIEQCNPAYCSLLGYAKEELIGQKVTNFIHPEDRAENLSLHQQLKEGLIPSIDIEHRYQRKGGQAVWVRKFASILATDDGVPASTLVLVTDITERKASETRLRQAHKMEAVGRLAGGVAHDFNNILTIINGYAELALNPAAKNERILDSLKMIKNAGDQAASLTRQLLVFSRQGVVTPKVIDVGDVVRETEKLLRRILGEDIVLVSRFEPDLRWIKMDPSLLSQVLLNLAVNARDDMPRGGTLTITTSNKTLPHSFGGHTGLPPGDYVRVMVEDTGAGMSSEVQAHIFEPFFTTKEIGKGTGLGLAVVHGIVEQSGGSIAVRSEPGRGSAFEICFPAVVKNVPADSASSSKVGTARGAETVLLVEDEEGVRTLTAFALRDQGYDMIAAANGREAIRLAEYEGKHIDLLITDVVMPEMGGRELAEKLQQSYPDLKVLFISGYTDDAVMRHGIAHEGVRFLHKPFTPASLAAKVREILDAP